MAKLNTKIRPNKAVLKKKLVKVIQENTELKTRENFKQAKESDQSKQKSKQLTRPSSKEDGLSDSDSDKELDPKEHKKSLEKLKDTDPDFYKFLEENDKNLLDFNIEDSDGDEKSGDEEEIVHQPSGELEVDSDESDFEPEDGSAPVASNKITLKMIAAWQTELQSENKIKLTTLSNVVKAFNAALLRVAAEDEKIKTKPAFKVEGTSVFNAVVQMCVLYLPPAIKKYLGTETSGKDPQKCKHFVKIKPVLIAYFTDLLKLLSNVSSTNILTVLLKHLHHMSNYVSCFSRISKLILKKLIVLWSTGEETVRVLAFLCLLRVTRNQQAALLESVLKTMYMTYVKNSKFVSPTTWPGIHFMRRSLVEMFTLDLNTSYQYVFLYIRQLAIHLRNAIVVQKTETRLAVYNWQYINSLNLWAELLSSTCNRPQLQPLIYPLVMIITNTVKLMPTPQYYPLRFHCLEILIKLSKDSDTFIPILPLIVEVLNNYDFNKRHKKVSMKPLDLSCILRVSKSQMAENGFKDSVIERIYALLLEYASNVSHNIAFPDLMTLTVMQLGKFSKKCVVSNYTKKLRQLTEKIEENSKFIERERKKMTFSLTNPKQIEAWETIIRNKGTPLSKFFESWYKINRLQKKKKITKNEELADDLPQIKRFKKTEMQEDGSEGPAELFPSDDEDDTANFPELSDDEGEPNQKSSKKSSTKGKISAEKESSEDEPTISDEEGVEIESDSDDEDASVSGSEESD